MTDRPSPEKDATTGRFVPGNNGGSGRPKGSRNKLAERFIDDLYAEWGTHGREAITAMREEKPGDFVKVVAGVIPKEMNLRVGEFDDMSDDELARELASISAQLANLTASVETGANVPAADSGGEGIAPRLH